MSWKMPMCRYFLLSLPWHQSIFLARYHNSEDPYSEDAYNSAVLAAGTSRNFKYITSSPQKMPWLLFGLLHEMSLTPRSSQWLNTYIMFCSLSQNLETNNMSLACTPCLLPHPDFLVCLYVWTRLRIRSGLPQTIIWKPSISHHERDNLGQR